MSRQLAARVAGALFVIADIAGVGGALLFRDSSTVTGMLLILAMALAVALIPAVLYPVLKEQNEALAFGYAILRTIEAVMLIVSTMAADDDDRAGPISQIVWSLSVMVLLYLLFRSSAVPRFISVWGLAGAPLYLASQLLILYRAPSLFAPIEAAVTAQFALNELVLAIWLLVKGFRSDTRRDDAAVPR
jgi:hypothetical protein